MEQELCSWCHFVSCGWQSDSWIILFIFTVAILCWLDSPFVPWPDWTEFYVRLPVLLGDVQVFFHQCLHAWCTILAAYLSADTVSYHCDGLSLCPSMYGTPLTFMTSAAQYQSWQHVGILLQGVSFWSLGPFSYYATKGPFCCEISMEWSPLCAVFLAGDPPFQILHLSEVVLFWPWLIWECPRVVVSWRGTI